MTTAQLLTWLRQRLPQLEPGQLPDPAIDLDDTRRTAADRLDQLRAAGRRARGHRIERPPHLRALQRPVRIIGLTPPLNSPPNVRIANAREHGHLAPGIDPDGDAVYLIAP